MERHPDQGPTGGLTAHIQIGDRYGQIVDPFGYCWSIGCPIKAEK